VKNLKYLRQLLIILIIYFLGSMLQLEFNIPVPGTVLGLLILFIALYSGLIKIEMIEEVSAFLLANMSLLFIPAGVGLMISLNILSGKWVAFITILVISTTLVFIVTAYTVKLLRRVL
jgi:holin-like protein